MQYYLSHEAVNKIVYLCFLVPKYLTCQFLVDGGVAVGWAVFS